MAVIYPHGDWCTKPREIPAIVNRLKKIEGQPAPSLLRTPEYQQVDLDDVDEEPAEEAEVVEYQPEFSGEGGPAPPFISLPEPAPESPSPEDKGSDPPAEEGGPPIGDAGAERGNSESEPNPLESPPEEKFVPLTEERDNPVQSEKEGGNTPLFTAVRGSNGTGATQTGASPEKMRPLRKEAEKAKDKIYKVFSDPYGFKEKKRKKN